MPVFVYSIEEHGTLLLAELCGEEWRLPHQVAALEGWLTEFGSHLPKNNYIADIGFRVRTDASGGGSALSPESLGTMAAAGMSLFLSEYPPA